MEIKGILFDKDGTLIDFYEVWGKAVEPVMERLLQKYKLSEVPNIRKLLWQGLGVDSDGRICSKGALAYKPYPEIAKDLLKQLGDFEGKPKTKELSEELKKSFYEEVCEKREKYPTFTDLPALMNQLSDMEIKIGIATTDEAASTKICMEKLGIAEKISFYGTAGGSLPVKPSGALMKEAARIWGIAPQEIAVVGDTPNDMQFAHNGKGRAIGVLSGTGRREELEPLSDNIIDSVDALLPLIKSINQKSENCL